MVADPLPGNAHLKLRGSFFGLCRGGIIIDEQDPSWQNRHG
jgi:hypothetical protein